MRDSIIYKGMNGLVRKVTHDVQLIHSNLTMCRTRIDAVESALFTGRFALIRAVFLSIFNPSRLKAEIDKWHEWHIRDYNNKIIEIQGNNRG